MTDKIQELQSIIDNARHIVFFTGAGVSTDSGIPDFRSQDGLYNMEYKYPPEEIISHHFYEENPEEFYRFYRNKMLWEAGKQDEESEGVPVSLKMLAMQGIATSIDALSVGFTIAEYDLTAALSASLIIGFVTYVICIIGVRLGRIAGMKYASKASVLGGCILIFIGIEIFVRGFFGI